MYGLQIHLDWFMYYKTAEYYKTIENEITFKLIIWCNVKIINVVLCEMCTDNTKNKDKLKQEATTLVTKKTQNANKNIELKISVSVIYFYLFLWIE